MTQKSCLTCSNKIFSIPEHFCYVTLKHSTKIDSLHVNIIAYCYWSIKTEDQYRRHMIILWYQISDEDQL